MNEINDAIFVVDSVHCQEIMNRIQTQCVVNIFPAQNTK